MIGRTLKDHFLSVWIDGPLWMSQFGIFTSLQIGQVPRPLEKGEWSEVGTLTQNHRDQSDIVRSL
jgi:hypothetical protein